MHFSSPLCRKGPEIDKVGDKVGNQVSNFALLGQAKLSGQSGDDAHHYQEKQVRNAIGEANK
jgi:hypothetical protein